MKALVTGGTGFVGNALARALAARGDEVHVFQRSPSPRLAALGITVHQGDLCDREKMRNVLEGIETVLHTAAKVGVWGRYEDFHTVNVTGVQNLLAACRDTGVARLVFTSSASVVFGGTDLEGVDESTPYPETPLTPYTATKAEAERLILNAAGDGLATVALRPHIVWGPADPHMVGRILMSVRQGRIALIGDGENKVDTTHIENAVAAHLLAADKLAPDAACNGKVYFITDGEPRPIRSVLNTVLVAADYPPITRSISERTAFRAAALTEWIYRHFKPPGEPAITRFVVEEFVQSHWFDIAAARRDLDYSPPVAVAEGVRQLRASFFPAQLR